MAVKVILMNFAMPKNIDYIWAENAQNTPERTLWKAPGLESSESLCSFDHAIKKF